MASPSSPSGSDAPTSRTAMGGDWPAQAADQIERLVGTVRDRTTGPAITAARWVVYGTFALLVGLVVLTMLAIAAVRIIDVYLPDSVFGEDHTWAAHLIVGLVFTIAGMVMWSRRSPADR